MERTHDKELDLLKAEIANLREDITKIFAGVKNFAETKVFNGVNPEKEHISNYIEKNHQLWTDLTNKFNSSRARGKKVVKDITSKVEEHPFISIIIALGVGYTMAKICTGKPGNTNNAD